MLIYKFRGVNKMYYEIVKTVNWWIQVRGTKDPSLPHMGEKFKNRTIISGLQP